MPTTKIDPVRDVLSDGATSSLSAPWGESALWKEHDPIPGVTLFIRKRKGFGGDRLTERAFRCDNGCIVGARRGGRLHAADKKTWAVFVLNHQGIGIGETFPYVDADRLFAMVEAVSAWETPA